MLLKENNKVFLRSRLIGILTRRLHHVGLLEKGSGASLALSRSSQEFFKKLKCIFSIIY